jgi:hypothetical protein
LTQYCHISVVTRANKRLSGPGCETISTRFSQSTTAL